MTGNKKAIQEMKRKAAKEALKFVKDGMVLGIGSGSTVREFIKLLGTSDFDTQKIVCIPSSLDTENMLIETLQKELTKTDECILNFNAKCSYNFAEDFMHFLKNKSSEKDKY